MLKYLNLWLPVFVWMFIIFGFSSRPTNPGSEIIWIDFVFKKSAHLGEYAIFFILLFRAFKNSTNESDKKIGILSFFLLILYAISDELHQSIIPGRTATVRDVFIDIAGGLIAIYTIWKLLPKMPSKPKNWVKKSLGI